MSDAPLRRCSICGVDKPATRQFFSANNQRKDGLDRRCKACMTIYQRQRSEAIEAIAQLPCAGTIKSCSICGLSKPATPEFFYKRRDSKDGLRSDCRDCFDAKQDVWRSRNPERVRANGRKHTALHRSKYREKVYYQTREWKARNKDKITDYRTRNARRFVVYRENRRARERAFPSHFTAEDWQYALEYFQHRCAVCERPVGLWHTLAADHWIPLSDPNCPGTVPENMLPLCHQLDGCNNSKGSRNPVEWLNAVLGEKKAAKTLLKIETFFSRVKAMRTR